MASGTVRQRDPRMDVIRLTALFFVCATHFFLESGYMDEPVRGPLMYFMTVLKGLFIICVPLFITLTGYLQCEKKLTARYFKGIVKVLLIYLICSVIYTVFARWIAGNPKYAGSLLHLARVFVVKLLSYRGTPYGWYIEMYIGLFLIIPFVNLGLEKLDTRRKANLLMIVLFLLIGLPSVMNVFSFESAEAFLHTQKVTRYTQLVPDWWNSIYPIFYYCLGWYLKKYPVRPKLGLHVSLAVAAVLLDAGFNYFKSDGMKFVAAAWNWDASSAFQMFTTFAIFSLMLRIPLKPAAGKGAAVLKLLSDSVLAAYLLSRIFDEVFYGKLKAAVEAVPARFPYLPLIAAAVFLCSMALSVVVTLAVRAASLPFGKAGRRP